MNDEIKKGTSFGKFGIIFGVFIVVLSIIWVTKIIISDEDTSGEDITWVG